MLQIDKKKTNEDKGKKREGRSLGCLESNRNKKKWKKRERGTKKEIKEEVTMITK